jgi:hypothetical protein
VFARSLGDTFYYVTAEAQRQASLALDALGLGDLSLRSWLIIAVVAVVFQRLWRRRPRR